MIACLLIPGFELRAALRARPRLALVPAALAPEAGEEPLLGPVTAAAEAAGVKPGMRLGEALATCPSLVLVDRDPAAVEREWEGVLRRLEDTGFAVDPVEQGAVVFETNGVERLYGGVQPALERALAAVGPDVGSAHRRRRKALHRARGGERRAARSDPARRGEGRRGVPRAAAALAAADDAESLRGARGARAALARRARRSSPAARSRSGSGWRGETRGGSPRAAARRVCADASPPRSSSRRSPFPEAIANEITLRRALGSLLERLLARPERAGRPFRKLALVARLVDGGSWRRVVTLRDATAETARLRAALGPKLQELPAPIVELRLEAVELAEHTGQQLALVEPAGEENVVRLREGLRQVRASTGTGSVCAVVEVAPWSRVPEARALVVPRDD